MWKLNERKEVVLTSSNNIRRDRKLPSFFCFKSEPGPIQPTFFNSKRSLKGQLNISAKTFPSISWTVSENPFEITY